VTATPAEHGEERRFHPTSGVGIGWTGVGLAAVAIVATLHGGLSVGGARFALAAALFALLVWCFMLRPRVVLGRTELELRNAFSSWHVPLAGVRRVMVRAITRIHTDDEHFDGIAVGRPLRTLTQRTPPAPKVGLPGLGQSAALAPAGEPAQPRGQLDVNAVADFLVERALQAADRAREAGQQPGTPRRSWAWLEIAALVALVVGLVVTFLL
jgi:hypothetical protein